MIDAWLVRKHIQIAVWTIGPHYAGHSEQPTDQHLLYPAGLASPQAMIWQS